MGRISGMPRYMKYFDELLEDLPVCQLPQELQSCGECQEPHSICHMLVAGRKGRRLGIDAVCIIRCSSCGALHLTQMYTNTQAVTGLKSPILESIARDLGIVFPPIRRVGRAPQPDA